MKVEIFIDNSKMPEIQEIARNVKQRTLNLTSNDLLRNIKINTPVSKGHGQNSWNIQAHGEDGRIVTSSAEYLKYPNWGTGIYAGKDRIRPKHGKALRFEYKGKVVYAKSVKGQKAQKFIEKSMNQTDKRIQGFFYRALEANNG